MLRAFLGSFGSLRRQAKRYPHAHAARLPAAAAVTATSLGRQVERGRGAPTRSLTSSHCKNPVRCCSYTRFVDLR